MRHTWKAGGGDCRWVLHSSRGADHGSDMIGVGTGEDYLGPFSSRKMAITIARALTNAYLAGKKDCEQETREKSNHGL